MPDPQSYYGADAEPWTCIFPGKHGVSWKRSWPGEGTRSQATAVASGNANVVPVPVALWLRYREYEVRAVAAEQRLVTETGLRLDYGDEGYVAFVPVNPRQEE